MKKSPQSVNVAAFLTLSFSLLLIGDIPSFAQGQGTQIPTLPDSLKFPLTLMVSDSILGTYSLEELVAYYEQYADSLADLEREHIELRDRSIKDAEKFISDNPESRVLDQVMMRLAELYYTRAEENYLTQIRRYEEDYTRFENGELAEPPQEPVKDFDSALQTYRFVKENLPQSEYVDDAAYNEAFIMEEMGNKEEALTIYRWLIDEFADSRYVPHALMRIAENYFNPPVNDIRKAIDIYKEVLYYTDSPKYNEALYRLGWSYYRLSEYSTAVSYFTLLADDIIRSRPFDAESKFSNPELIDESIEYLGISFLDFGGPAEAARYLQSIGDRVYGVKVLQRIGDAYMDEKEQWEDAVYSYQLLLAMYPTAPEAPKIQSKIVEAYRHLEDEMMAYLVRGQLYSQYLEGSTWWEENPDESARREALSYAEAALRDNITMLYQRAEETKDQDFYLQAISDSRRYLTTFAGDTSAPRVHWNMALTYDTKIGDHEAAYNEYIAISQKYWNSRYQKYAAENAIALARDAAQTAVARAESLNVAARAEVLPVDSTADREASIYASLRYEPTDLLPSEIQLGEAYDNYLMLFPHDQESATILTNAGALYYNHHQFIGALKYFKTLAMHFQESEELEQAQYTIMESYFGRMDFKSAEIVAKRIMDSDAAPDVVAKAKRRLAESIFLSAELLAENEDYKNAGEEYCRVVAEVPDVEFADLALFNGALAFDKGGEYNRAIETYSLFLDTFPNSEFILDVLNNLAFDYRELKDYRNAAITYRRLATTQPDPVLAKDALFNASVCFAAAEEWESAIQVNRQFIALYPEAEEADDLYCDIAGYYLKLRDWESANRVYGEFVERYPNSPRVVESYYRRGEYFREKSQNENAQGEYRKAVARNDALKAQQLESNDYFAAEALFGSSEIDYGVYDRIQFRLPVDEQKRNIQRKRDLLLELVNNYAKVAGYGTVRLYESTHKVGRCYEEFAETWARQELPQIEENRRIVAQNEIADAAAELYSRTVYSYKNSIGVLARLAEDYQLKLEVPAGADSAVVAAEDSVLREAYYWIDRCKESVSENLYNIGELKMASVERLLSAPLPEGLDLLTEMEYRRQILTVAVAPLVAEMIEAHKNNIHQAQLLGLENEWVELSRSKIISISNIIPDNLLLLTIDDLENYKKRDREYFQLIESGAQETAEGLAAIDLADEMVNLIDFGTAFAKLFTVTYDTTVRRARALELDEEGISITEERISKGLYYTIDKLDTLLTNTGQRRKYFETRFRETQNAAYERALFTYEDNYFAIHEGLSELLTMGQETSTALGIENIWTKNILLQLARFQPNSYASQIGLTVVTDTVRADGSWRVWRDYVNGWTTTQFADTAWQQSAVVTRQRGSAIPAGQYLWLGTPRSGVEPTAAQSVTAFTKVGTCYFRGKFEASGLPVFAQIKTTVDGAYNLFLNGHYIAQVVNEPAAGVDTYIHNLTEYCEEGENVLALEVKDVDGSIEGLSVVLFLNTLPGWREMRESLLPPIIDDKEKILKREQIPF